jgi:hypothetical protein
MRRGLMPWGRERLADGYYEKAVSEMNKPVPDQKKALWYLSCAIDMHPLFSEAIALKSKITGHEATASDNSTIRGFVHDAIMAGKGAAYSISPPTVVPPLLPTPGQAQVAPFAAAPRGARGPTTAPATQPLMVKVEPSTLPAVANPGRGAKGANNVAATDVNEEPGGD